METDNRIAVENTFSEILGTDGNEYDSHITNARLVLSAPRNIVSLNLCVSHRRDVKYFGDLHDSSDSSDSSMTSTDEEDTECKPVAKRQRLMDAGPIMSTMDIIDIATAKGIFKLDDAAIMKQIWCNLRVRQDPFGRIL